MVLCITQYLHLNSAKAACSSLHREICDGEEGLIVPASLVIQATHCGQHSHQRLNTCLRAQHLPHSFHCMCLQDGRMPWPMPSRESVLRRRAMQ